MGSLVSQNQSILRYVLMYLFALSFPWGCDHILWHSGFTHLDMLCAHELALIVLPEGSYAVPEIEPRLAE